MVSRVIFKSSREGMTVEETAIRMPSDAVCKLVCGNLQRLRDSLQGGQACQRIVPPRSHPHHGPKCQGKNEPLTFDGPGT